MAGKAFFMMRLNDHIQYLKKMDAALKGESDFKGCRHTECKLGGWLYGDGPKEVAELTDPKAKAVFESMLEPHEQFHAIGQKALEQKEAGDDAAAQAALTELHTLSAVLTDKLLNLDGMK